MPSNKDPSVVQPGPGKLAAGQVPASALAFPFSGSGDLSSHITDPIDAHMSGAVGIPEFNPTTGQPLLSTAGGPYDGESVLDALAALADLLPVRPDAIGFNNVVPNSGLPDWTSALTVGGLAEHGGWTDGGGNGIVTKYLTPNGSLGAHVITGIVYPADRGVLAVYKTTDADFFNPGQTTLEMALWLGVNPPPAGIPGAAFVEATRPVSQSDYVASLAGLDKISLIDRLPYLANYPGSEYAPFSTNFSSYQLAKFDFSVTLIAGDNESYLLVHWKETYATSLAAIQPASLTALTLTTGNCYSAVPSAPSSFENVNRKNIFLDTDSASGPTVGTLTTAPAGTITSTPYSGIEHYNSTGLTFNFTATATDVFKNSYRTNQVATGSVPVGFESTEPPAKIDLTAFGGLVHPYSLYDNGLLFVDDGTGLAFTLASPPVILDVARAQNPSQAIGGAASTIPWPYGQVGVEWRSPFGGLATQASTERYIYNPVAGSLTTNTYEPLNDESYRHISSFAAGSPATPILPAGGNAFVSATLLASGDGNLQVHSGRLIYPSTNFTVAPYNPTTPGGDYAAVLAGDAANHIRRHVRAFNTGIARNTGKIRLKGLALVAFASTGAFTGSEVADHTGGAIVQVKVPGSTGWLDLGRSKGDPDLATTDFRGCSTGTSGPDVTVSYDTTAFTVDNGFGDFLIFVRVSFIKNGTGETLDLQEVEWLPP